MTIDSWVVDWPRAQSRNETRRQEALADLALRLDEAERPEFEHTARIMIERHQGMFTEMHRAR